ncbi:hypothetical protein [Streptomyces cyaneogriseus]|uniref:hypothetical protein n=1 Tax=Streptomyces cyaneogriseus TaxID=68192 RepID=UPI00069A304B|nr:hypothetical protein [Streptomyces cyaneogriseus]
MTTLGPGSGDTPGEPEGTPPDVPEEVWQKFLADSEDAIRGGFAPREPSARERVPGGWPGPLPDAGTRRGAGAAGPHGDHGRDPYGDRAYGSYEDRTYGSYEDRAYGPNGDGAYGSYGSYGDQAYGPYGDQGRGANGGRWHGWYGGQAHAVTGHGAPAGAVGELWEPEDPRRGPGWRALDRRARLRLVGRVAGAAAAVALAVAAWSLVAGPGAPGGGTGPATVQQLEDAPQGLPTATARPVGGPAARVSTVPPADPGDARCAPPVSWPSPSRQPEPWSCG